MLLSRKYSQYLNKNIGIFMTISSLGARTALATATQQPVIAHLVVDASGSMYSVVSEVTQAVLDFIQNQATASTKKASSLLMNIAQFDDTYQPVFTGFSGTKTSKAGEDSSVNKRFTGASTKSKNELAPVVCESDYSGFLIDTTTKAQDCFRRSYGAYGGTAIRDALKESITRIEEQLKSGKRDPKQRVLIGLITDGQDFDSRTTQQEISDLVRKKIQEGWDFFLLGTPDAKMVEVGEGLGFLPDQAATYDQVSTALKFLSDKVSKAREDRTASLGITQEERLQLAAPTKDL